MPSAQRSVALFKGISGFPTHFFQPNHSNEIPMKLLKKNLTLLAASALLSFSLPHLAQAADSPAKDVKKTEMTAMSADMSDGEIRKVDKDSSKVTIKHGEIKNLDMPPMTMVFKVKDPAMLDALKVGDKIRFKAVSEKGSLIIADLVPMK